MPDPGESDLAITDTPRLDAWRREWRRFGGAMTGGSLVALVGWVNVSRTYVGVGPKGALVHPSPYSYVFWVLVGGAVIGVWCFLSTYLDWLPWAGKRRARELDRILLERSVAYAIQVQGVTLSVENYPDRSEVRVAVGVLNGSTQPISWTLKNASATADGIASQPTVGAPAVSRLLPANQAAIHFPEVLIPAERRPFANGPIEGQADFVVEYRHIEGGRTRTKHGTYAYRATETADGRISCRNITTCDDDQPSAS